MSFRFSDSPSSWSYRRALKVTLVKSLPGISPRNNCLKVLTNSETSGRWTLEMVLSMAQRSTSPLWTLSDARTNVLLSNSTSSSPLNSIWILLTRLERRSDPSSSTGLSWAQLSEWLPSLPRATEANGLFGSAHVSAKSLLLAQFSMTTLRRYFFFFF